MPKKPTLNYGRVERSERLQINWRDWRLIPVTIIAVACFVFLIWRIAVVLGPG